MKEIMSARDVLVNQMIKGVVKPFDETMIEFARWHVEAALKEASEDAKVLQYANIAEVDKESILNAYPLENIK